MYLHFTLCCANKKYTILPIKVISVNCNRNLHYLITYKFPHFYFLVEKILS